MLIRDSTGNDYCLWSWENWCQPDDGMLDNLVIIEGLMDYLLDWWIGCKLFDTLMTVKMVLKLPMIHVAGWFCWPLTGLALGTTKLISIPMYPAAVPFTSHPSVRTVRMNTLFLFWHLLTIGMSEKTMKPATSWGMLFPRPLPEPTLSWPKRMKDAALDLLGDVYHSVTAFLSWGTWRFNMFQPRCFYGYCRYHQSPPFSDTQIKRDLHRHHWRLEGLFTLPVPSRRQGTPSAGASQMEAELQRVDALLSLQGDDLLQALQAGRKLEEGCLASVWRSKGYNIPRLRQLFISDINLYMIYSNI